MSSRILRLRSAMTLPRSEALSRAAVLRGLHRLLSFDANRNAACFRKAIRDYFKFLTVKGECSAGNHILDASHLRKLPRSTGVSYEWLVMMFPFYCFFLEPVVKGKVRHMSHGIS